MRTLVATLTAVALLFSAGSAWQARDWCRRARRYWSS